MRFFLVLVIALAIGLSIYFSTHFFAFNYIRTVYSSEENKKEREREYIKDLQEFATVNGISSEHTGKLSEWAKEHKYVYLLIYKDDQLFYTSDDEPEVPSDEPEAPGSEVEDPSGDAEDPEGDVPGGEGGGENPTDPTNPNPTDPDATDPDGTDQTEPDENGTGSTDNPDKNETTGKEDDNDKPDKEPGGVTIDYPTREELFEYAQKNELHPLELEDGTMLASLTEFTEYLYFDLANIGSLVLGVLFVIVFITLYFQGVTNRIIHLGKDVNKIAAGDMDHKIKARGRDEISKLSANVDNMRDSIITNLKKEREALASNTELITSMSHDIRTPLTVLLGYIDVMQAKAEGDVEMQSYLGAAESTAMRLKKLSDDMFSYFLVFGDGEMDIKAEDYDAITLIDQMLSEHILLMKESEYKVELYGFDFAGFSSVQIKTDAQKLVRIFDNVFQNIYKYADKSLPVSIYITKKEDCAEIVFENFIAKDIGKVESNGIGLKTCKKLGEYIGAGFETETDGEKFKVLIALKCQQ